MAMIIGKGTVAQIGTESIWGLKAVPTVALNYTSESLKNNLDRKEEETLLGGKTSRYQDIMKYSVDGDIALVAKPKNIGLILSHALGVEEEPALKEGTSNVYIHKFTPLPVNRNSSLPSLTAIIDRVVACKAYTGLKVGQLSFSCEAGDYMKVTATLSGRAEEDGEVVKDLQVPELKAFRFAGGSCTFDGEEFGEVTSVSVEYNNNLDDGEQTLGSGYYGTEKEPQAREITLTLESFYNAKTETVREKKYLTESTVAIKLNFISPNEIEDGQNYKIEFDMPLVCINDCSPNVGDSGKLKLSIGGKALESASQEAITITLEDDNSEKYI